VKSANILHTTANILHTTANILHITANILHTPANESDKQVHSIDQMHHAASAELHGTHRKCSKSSANLNISSKQTHHDIIEKEHLLLSIESLATAQRHKRNERLPALIAQLRQKDREEIIQRHFAEIVSERAIKDAHQLQMQWKQAQRFGYSNKILVIRTGWTNRIGDLSCKIFDVTVTAPIFIVLSSQIYVYVCASIKSNSAHFTRVYRKLTRQAYLTIIGDSVWRSGQSCSTN